MSPCHLKVGKNKDRIQLRGVFRKASVGYIGKFELAIEYSKVVLDLGTTLSLLVNEADLLSSFVREIWPI